MRPHPGTGLHRQGGGPPLPHRGQPRPAADPQRPERQAAQPNDSGPQGTVERLEAAGLDLLEVTRIVRATLAEDLGGPDGEDITSAATIDESSVATADIVARANGVIAGLPVAAMVFEAASRTVAEFTYHVAEGAEVAAGTVLATVSGPTRALLTAERSALNLLCRMSGVATHTRSFVKVLAGSRTRILDTRKTTPGLRSLEKYAVRAGGGTNKRMGLYDVAMIKDNHKLAAGGISAAYQRVRAAYPDKTVQVEVTTVEEAVEAVRAGATFLLCDNMRPDLLARVVATIGNRAELEATGRITLADAVAYAKTGVNYVSVGALTHSSPIVDIAMDLRVR